MPTVIDTILKALSDVIPERVTAGHKGEMSGIAIYGRDEQRGRPFICLNIFGGGFGAKAKGDGMSGVVSIAQGAVQNAPVEVQEAYYPLIIEAHRLRQDSGGAGEHRGGLGAQLVIGSDQDIFMNLSFVRTKLAPWGLHGGLDALPMDAVLETREGEKRPATVIDKQLIRPGDRVVISGGGGGGYGDPLDRPLAQVALDVADGYVSSQAARTLYGVVLADDGEADVAASEALRAEMREGRKAKRRQRATA